MKKKYIFTPLTSVCEAPVLINKIKKKKSSSIQKERKKNQNQFPLKSLVNFCGSAKFTFLRFTATRPKLLFCKTRHPMMKVAYH